MFSIFKREKIQDMILWKFLKVCELVWKQEKNFVWKIFKNGWCRQEKAFLFFKLTYFAGNIVFLRTYMVVAWVRNTMQCHNYKTGVSFEHFC